MKISSLAIGCSVVDTQTVSQPWKANRHIAANFRFEESKKWAIYMLLNTVTRSLNVCTSSTILKAWYNFTRRERFYGNSKTHFDCSSLTKFLFFRHFCRGSNTKFHGNPPSGMRVVTYEQTDGHNTKRMDAFFATLRPNTVSSLRHTTYFHVSYRFHSKQR
jgi:hypothetical protein